MNHGDGGLIDKRKMYRYLVYAAWVTEINVSLLAPIVVHVSANGELGPNQVTLSGPRIEP